MKTRISPSTFSKPDKPNELHVAMNTRKPSGLGRYRSYGLSLFVMAALSAGGLLTNAQAQDDLKGLRGIDVAEPDTLPAGTFRSTQDSELIERNYEQQPPVIPHKIDGYEISLNFNRCMDCHSDARYKEMNATRVSQTHYKTRDGQELANISPRRYFCVQCHVPQTDARPLVENTYQRTERQH